MARRLMAVLAHPDDESLGIGGTLAKYAAEGVDVSLVTATPGDAGRFRGLRPGDPQHPGKLALSRIRESELRAAPKTRCRSPATSSLWLTRRAAPPSTAPSASRSSST